MNDSKTYTISEDLFIAIIERAYAKGCSSGYSGDVDNKEAVDHALEIVRNQQFVYED